MPMFDFRCTNCSYENEHLEPADAPLRICDLEGCDGIMERVYRGKAAQPLADSIPGGLVLENYGPEPIKVYSHSERRALMKERGLVEKDTYAPSPYSDKSPIGNTKWSSGIDPQTLANVTELLSRGATRVPTRQYLDDGSVIDTDTREHTEGMVRGLFNENAETVNPATRRHISEMMHKIGERRD